LNEQCADYERGVYLVPVEERHSTFYCPTCRFKGRRVNESGAFTRNHDCFREVRVEYLYDPNTDTYKGLAIIRDEELDNGDVYTLRSPLIKGDKRALKVAEGLLSTLVYHEPEEGTVPSSAETILSTSSPTKEFTQQLNTLIDRWESSPMARVKQQKGRA